MLYNITISYLVNEHDFVFYFLLLLMIYQSDKTLYHITYLSLFLFTLCTNAFYLIYFLYV